MAKPVACIFWDGINVLMTELRVEFGELIPHRLRYELQCQFVYRRLPMARVWPAAKFGLPSTSLDDSQVLLPPQAEQDVLVDIFFTYVHPTFPVLYKARFMSEFQER